MQRKCITDRRYDSTPTGEISLVSSLLGKGSFGSVYRGADATGKQYACKCCEFSKFGVPSILEASIMTAIDHPHINGALVVDIDDTSINIIQHIASCDVSKYLTAHTEIPFELIRKWCFEIAQAVKCLHDEHIIHADIKTNNVLVYPDLTVKLTDFTLSRRQWSIETTQTVPACNTSYRPYECLAGKTWSYPLDVWALGCTFYNMVYREVLFHGFQRKTETDSSVRKYRCVNALIDWSHDSPWYQGDGILDYVTQQKYPIDYHKPQLTANFTDPQYRVFNDLLGNMLQLNPARRATMDQILQHEWFAGLTPVGYTIWSHPHVTLHVACVDRYERYIGRAIDTLPDTTRDITSIRELATRIVHLCHSLTDISEQTRAYAAVWIACKLCNVSSLRSSIPPHHLFAAERSMCSHLRFCLHTLID